MKIAWVKEEKDKNNFRLQENLGWNVYKIKDTEEIDNELERLIENHYDTIVISNELSFFSEDIIKKYNKNKNVNIIINFK